MSLKKKYVKNNSVCKVTFEVSKEAAQGAKSVHLVGDFNEWNKTSHPMKPLKSGAYTITVDLQGGLEYQFRYLIDGDRWENDNGADKYAPTIYGDTENSVVAV
jgi:1,4-alpha-glucan branching enzyme